MAERHLDWTQLRAFAAVLREGSLSAAARALEAALGGALFDRLPNGLRPTPRALALLAEATAMDDAASALAAALTANRGDAAGTVRVTAPETLGARAMAPLLAGVMAAHPEIEIELSATDQTENLLRRDADIGVRIIRPAQEELIARRVGAVEFGLYASRAYLARHGMPADLRAMARHRLIGPDKNASARAIAARIGVGEAGARFAFRTDNRIAQESAVRAGIGIGLMRTHEASAERELVRVLPERVFESLPLWLVAHADMRQSRRLRLVYDALAEGLRGMFRPRGPA